MIFSDKREKNSLMANLEELLNLLSDPSSLETMNKRWLSDVHPHLIGACKDAVGNNNSLIIKDCLEKLQAFLAIKLKRKL